MFSIKYIQRRRLQVLATYIQPILTSRLSQCLYSSVVSCYCSVLSEQFHSRQSLIPLTFPLVNLKNSNPSNLPCFNNMKIYVISSTNSNASNLDIVLIPRDTLTRGNVFLNCRFCASVNPSNSKRRLPL